MQTVILAGGLGTRLKPITRDVPKPMVPVLGRPFLEHQIEMLCRNDLTDILLLVGYRGEQVQEYFGTGHPWDVRISYSFEPEPLGTGGALRNAEKLLEEVFLLVYGDSYLPINYRDVAAAFRASGAAGMLVVYDNEKDTTVPRNVALGADGRVVRYEKNSHNPALRHVEAGVLAFRREVVGLIEPGRKVSLEEEIFPLLIEEGRLAGYVTRQRFYDIGTPERLATFEAFLK